MVESVGVTLIWGMSTVFIGVAEFSNEDLPVIYHY